ncbi:MAG TPA: WecB/TagA/CpsF family glycosyltransferase [Vicinamibacterales bacterium]|nr:WecB/TagA/CpsF family glycosyltransferase [Vicinamibacterales bacterium]
MSRVDVLGTAIDNVSLDEALASIMEKVEAREYSYAVTPNVDHVMRLRRDQDLRSIYDRADFVLADGVPLVWASALLHARLKGRVNGTDLLEGLCASAAARGLSVFLLGGDPGTADRAGERLSRRFRGLRVAGAACPSASDVKDVEANRRLQTAIQTSGADILFVGLGSPKQERWIARYARQTGVSFAVGIGVSFSFVAGDIARAPVWMQRCGLEWLWRLAMEPRRLWKRYLVDDAPFVWLIGKELASRRLTAVRRAR